ncbi:MAG: 4Fe-4S binding protein [Chlorobiaceae bacterium]|nr:4Fe-4S binding protein [Chlorobiaceae bacterium]
MMDNHEEITLTATPSAPERPGQRKRGLARNNPDQCTGCGICVKSCPTGCITIIESELNFNGVAHIDDNRCTGCNICAIDCPWFAIDMLNPDGSRRDPSEYAKQAHRLRGYH